MKKQYAAAVSAGDRVDTHFVLRTRDVRQARTGEPYLAFELTDRSGSLAGIMFRPSREAETAPQGSVVRVSGSVTSYRGTLRLKVDSLRVAADYDPRRLLPVGVRDPQEVLADLRALVRTVKDPAHSRLLRRIFGDAAFMDAFKACPATDAGHHPYIGGLLEHTVAVAAACRHHADIYPELDADLLVTAALVHDIGMVDALARDAAFVPTDEGRMLGHPALGERRVNEALAAIGGTPSRELGLRLRHAVLAHHGGSQPDGSPAPRTLEALVLARADALDADVSAFAGAMSVSGPTEERWTDASNAFGRPLLAPRAITGPDAQTAVALPHSA